MYLLEQTIVAITQFKHTSTYSRHKKMARRVSEKAHPIRLPFVHFPVVRTLSHIAQAQTINIRFGDFVKRVSYWCYNITYPANCIPLLSVQQKRKLNAQNTKDLLCTLALV